ncbi:MAG: acyl-CoA dehydrogenase family protein [Myxococcota bacterium]|nr:acyl-CoA dehydrogenase family protein [Myxococcota bacterium]
MDFATTEIEGMLIESATTFAERCLRPRERSHEKAGEPDAETRRAWAECGLDMLADSSGELEVSGPGRVQVLRALAAADGAATLALWLPALARSAAQSLGVIPGEELTLTAVLLEPEVEGVDWPRPCLPMGQGKAVLVLGREGDWGLARVETEGVLSLGLKAAGMASATFVDWEQRGSVAPEQAAAVRASVRLSAAALLVGIACAARDYVAGYLPERVAFGKPLSEHQGLAFLFADMAMATEAADLLVCRAAWELDCDRPEAAVDAWLQAREAALRVTDLGVQLLGGHGYMDDHPVEKWMRDARALALLFGGEDEALREAAAQVEL